MAQALPVIFTILISLSQLVSSNPDVSELAALRDKARDAVVLLTDDVLNRFILGRSRPYTVAIFFSAEQVTEKNPNLRLDDLRMEFGLAAKAFAKGPDSEKIFFFDAALETSQKPFALLQVNSLPYVVRIPADLPLGSPAAELGKGDKMLPETVGTRNYPWPAETFVEFMGGRHGLEAAEIDRPSIYKSPLFPAIVVTGVVLAGFLLYKMYTMSLLHHPALWTVLSMAVFWFSMSGGMYNIIRGVPFFMRDRKGNFQLLGVEGFTMGTLYLLVSGSIAFITFIAPRISNRILRDFLSIVGTIIAAGSIYQTFMIWAMKTGYRHVLKF